MTSGREVACTTSSQCAGVDRCWVEGAQALCHNPMDIMTQRTRVTRTANGECVPPRPQCIPDPLFPFLKTCQCDPLAPQCQAGTVCDPVTRRCLPASMEVVGTAEIVCGGASVCGGSGCCRSPVSETCMPVTATCAGTFVGCEKSDDCAGGSYCSYDPTARKTRCLNGIDGVEACSPGFRCLAGGGCTGHVDAGFGLTLPFACR